MPVFTRSAIQICFTVGVVFSLLFAPLRGDERSAFSPGCPSLPTQRANSFALSGVNVFDGLRMRDKTNVVVVDGIIAAMGRSIAIPDDIAAYECRGYSLLPGFIDAHTHNSIAGMVKVREDALRFGVTTHLDMVADPAIIAPARRQRESRERVTEADLWSAGRLVSRRSLQEGEIPDIVAARIAEGSDYIKITIYTGEMFGDEVPTLDEKQLAAIVAATRAQGKMAVAHVLTLKEAILAVNAGVDGLVHAFGNEPVPDSLVAAMKRQRQFVIPTLTYAESISAGEAGLRHDRRLVDKFSEEQRQSLQARASFRVSDGALLKHLNENVRVLHENGVQILAGTDSPNPGTAAGASLHHELELLVAAGLSPQDALRAATSVPAERFGLDDRGRIRQGLRADFLLVNGDPLRNITASRDIVAVWKNGYRVALEP